MSLNLPLARSKQIIKSQKKKAQKSSTQPIRFHLGPGYNDGVGAVNPLRYSIPNGTPYVDFNSEGAISSTRAQLSLLTPILGAGGVLPNFPSIATPIFTGGSLDVYAKVKVHSILVSYSARGSEGTALAAGDLYNTIRVLVFTTGVVYSVTPVIPLETETFRWPNMVDTTEILLDLKLDLPTISFEPSTRYNAPAMRTYRQLIPVNKTFDCYTTTDTGTTGWDTKNGNLIFAAVSDSTVSPHPTQQMNIRVFYEIVRP